MHQLRRFIEDLNNRHGLELRVSDCIMLDAILRAMADNKELTDTATAHSEDFFLVFESALEEEVVKIESTSRSFFQRFFCDDAFRDAAVREAAAEFHRRSAAEPAA